MKRRKPPARRSLPKTINVGIYEYRMIHWNPKEAESEGLLGKCNRFTFEIAIRDDLPDSSFAEVLEHEINHACWHAADLKSKGEEEHVVNRMTPIQMMVRRDNPEIYRWIDKAIAQKD